MTEYKWGKWKKVDLTTYPFFLEDGGERPENLGDSITAKENQILQDIFSLEFGGKNLEYFDPEGFESPPPIPDELKIYCPIEEQNTEFWPSEIGNTEEHQCDWYRWFYLDYFEAYESVNAYRNRRLGSGWYLVEFEGLSPILIRPIKEKK
jgi:hypothetical protein